MIHSSIIKRTLVSDSVGRRKRRACTDTIGVSRAFFRILSLNSTGETENHEHLGVKLFP
jgi:hypothetical protein